MIPILLFIQGNIKNISQFEGFAGSFRRGKWGIFLMGKDKSPIFGEYSPNMGDLQSNSDKPEIGYDFVQFITSTRDGLSSPKLIPNDRASIRT
jgi:hypothetical protein